MARMQLNDDGTITMPLIGGGIVTLREPSMRELAAIHTLVVEADEALPNNPVLPDNPTPEQVGEANRELRERARAIYSDASPHGLAVLNIIQMLATAENGATPEVGVDLLPGWAMSPGTCRQILQHFQLPLPGPGDGV